MLPSKKDKKKLMAADGMAMGNPGDPRIKNMVKTLPDNYFDIFGGQPQHAQTPGLAPIDKGTPNVQLPNQNPQQINPNAYNPGVRPPQNIPQRNKGIGNAIMLGLEAVDAAIPGERIHNQQVIHPQEGYNPYSLGTGSQALMDDGGWMMNPARDTPIVIPEGIGDNMPSAKSGNWIKGAVNPKHKGYCTPMTKSTCTPRRKAFAMTMKKHHGFHKKAEGGTLQYEDVMLKGGGIIPDPMSAFSPHQYENGGSVNFLENIMFHPNQADMAMYPDGGKIGPGDRYTPSPAHYYFGQMGRTPTAKDSAAYRNDMEAIRTGSPYSQESRQFTQDTVIPGLTYSSARHNDPHIDQLLGEAYSRLNAYNEGLVPGTMQLDLPKDTKKKKGNNGMFLENIMYHPNAADMQGFADGGPVKPIQVSNINDPRLRAYQDSLTLNRMSQPLINMSRSKDPVDRGTWEAQTHQINSNPAFNAAKEELYRMHGSYPQGNTVPVMTRRYTGSGILGNQNSQESNVVYPAPVQPVMMRHEDGGTLRGGSDTMNIFEQIVQHPNMADMKGWDKAKSGKSLSPAKAREMLHDKTAHGHKLTDRQRKYFGAVASGYAASGIGIGPGDPPAGSFNAKNIIRSSGSGIEDARFVDQLNYTLASGNRPKGDLSMYDKDHKDLITGAYLWKQQNVGKQPEDVIQGYYNKPVSQGNTSDALRQRLGKIGYGPTSMYYSSPDQDVQMRQGATPAFAAMRNGGVMYDDGGQVDTMWGGNVEQISDNPNDGGTMQFNGASHDNGGIGMHYNGSPVEVEGGETASRDSQGNLNIYGNMYLPGTRTKFKSIAKEIGQKEKRYDYLKTRGSELVNNSNPANKFEKLAFNAGKAMMSGGSVGQKDLAEKKDKLASLQRAMLDTAAEHGLDAQHMSAGKIKKAKGGASIPFAADGDQMGPGNPNEPGRSTRNNNPGNIKYGKWAKQHGASGKDKDGFAIFPDKSVGSVAMQNLLKSPKYKNKTVSNAIKTWTGGSPYEHDFGGLENKKVADLNPEEFGSIIAGMTYGEDTRYGATPKPRTPAGPTPRYGIPNIPLTPDAQRTPPGRVTPPDLDHLNPPDRRHLPSNVEPLRADEVAPELYAAATNKVEPVAMQHYRPELFQPYQVSFQDRINQNQATYNALQRTLGATNPSALGEIAAQKYAADSGVKGEEFRTNQAISNDITNKNKALLNDAQLKNLGLADQQYVRQSTAKSKTKQLNQMILNSLSSKYAQNELENKKLAAYENLYDYRFTPGQQGGLETTYMGPNAVFNYNNNQAQQRNNADVRTVSRYDTQGNLKGYTEYDDNRLKEAKDAMDLEMRRRKLPLLTAPPLQ